MVVKMMKWRPWPPLISRKFEVKLTVHKLEGCDWVCEGAERDYGGLAVEIRWKGPKISLGTFRRTVKRNCTREEVARRVDDGSNDAVLVEWDEEFHSVCSLSGYKGNVFHPWEISFAILQVGEGAKNKISVVGLGALNLADYAFKTKEQPILVKVPLTVSNTAVESHPSLSISLDLLELQGAQQSTELVAVMPVPPSSGEASSMDKDEVSALKAGLRKVKFFTEFVSTRRPRKAGNEDEGSEGRYFSKSEDDEYAYPSDSDSPNESEEGAFDEGKAPDCAARKSFTYGTLASANNAGVSCFSSAIDHDSEDWIYYSNRRRSNAGCSPVEDPLPSAPEQPLMQNSKRSILPWKKRKYFKSPKAKGEPLLNRANGEEGGDDIDFDRRQLSSDESRSPKWHRIDEGSNTNPSSVSEFGDDSFAVGVWEQREVTSRDGHMKIQTQIFFASIDQRSERAAGESACTVLVAVIADWLQRNHSIMPNRSQFDGLIADGSMEWRNLCENDVYKELFPDKHFDLETVLQSKIRDLCIAPESSFVGFFHPDAMEGEDQDHYNFLRGAMSFDEIWDEISRAEASVFVVSWNDHFFVLKVEREAYYIIDTLGERLHEGCSQAYILKFDSNTAIYKLQHANEPLEEPHDSNMQEIDTKMTRPEESGEKEDEVVVFRGKESCREYIKNFLAAIPIRELEADVKKGLASSTPLHHRLQIELHYTRLQQS